MDFKSKYVKYKKKYLNLIKNRNEIKRQKLNKIINNTIKKNYQLGGASSENNAFLDQFQKLIICPISHSIIIDPVTTSDGQTYDREHIEQWLQTNTTSPLTGAELDYYEVVPNIALKNVIEFIINEGMLDMEVITEYLENLELSHYELNQKISQIIRKKIKNSNALTLNLPEGHNRIYVTGIDLKYGYDLLKNKYTKEVLIIFSNDQIFSITNVEGEDTKIQHFSQFYNIMYHVRPVSQDSFKDVVILEGDSNNIIKEELEQNILSDDFYKIVKNETIPDVIISPRIKYNPVFYTFMNYENCNIINKINSTLIYDSIQEYNDLHTGISKQIFSVKKNVYKELLTASNDRINDIVQTDIQNLNDRLQNTRYTLCGIFMEDIPYIGKEIVSLSGESWSTIIEDKGKVWKLSNGRIAKKQTEFQKWKLKENYIIAFTGEKGIGKSYLTHNYMKPSAIFETDNCTKETFLEIYFQSHNPQVIVVGLRDPTFDLAFIKSQLEKPVYECRIVNISERFNHEEEQRLEALRLEQERLRQEALLEQQQPAPPLPQDDDGVYVIVYNTTQTPTTAETDAGSIDGFNYVHKFYLSNNRVITLTDNFGACGSGWTTATWASMKVTNYDNSELEGMNRLPAPIRYLRKETRNQDDYENITHIIYFDNDRTIEVNEIGGDGYYPSGYVRLNNF